MSYNVFFAFSTGFKEPIVCPVGELARILAHVQHVEETLSIKRTRYLDNPEHWDTFDPEFKQHFPSVTNEVLCEVAAEHNAWVRHLYDSIGKWAKEPAAGGEPITPEQAQSFWPGLQQIAVPVERWTPDYYIARMESLYEVMRGRESEGVTFNAKRALTERQAAAVITLFAEFLDHGDRRLDVPHGRDYLASSYDGGYDWCEQCGRAMVFDDAAYCKRRKCPLKEEMQ